jgi:hypothetical protein
MDWQDSPFFEAFEEDPLARRANFFSRFTGFRPQQQELLQGLFDPVFNRYLGLIGQEIRDTGRQSTTYSDYLTRDFNPYRELLRAPTGQGRVLGGRTIYDLR